jgi:hypothetical protein
MRASRSQNSLLPGTTPALITIFSPSTTLEKLNCISSAPGQPSLRFVVLTLLPMAPCYQRIALFIGRNLEHGPWDEDKMDLEAGTMRIRQGVRSSVLAMTR